MERSLFWISALLLRSHRSVINDSSDESYLKTVFLAQQNISSTFRDCGIHCLKTSERLRKILGPYIEC